MTLHIDTSNETQDSERLEHVTNQETETESNIEAVLGAVHLSKHSIEHVFFLFRPIVKPLLKSLETLHEDINALVRDMRLERTFEDTAVAISQSVGYTVDYKNRKFLYLLSMQALSIVVNGNILATVPGKWFAISYPRGTMITGSTVSDASPVTVTIRACDQFGYDQ